ncbi:MAG: hypothetical protein WC759_00615 [Candidatus Micrarchaeia archaeon]|jgi:hypothetical protein
MAGHGQEVTEYIVLLLAALIIAILVIGVLGWLPGIAGSANATAAG